MAGGRVGVTKQDVFKACDNLLKAGFDVTNPAVRKELGGGSYTTITPLVDLWKEEHASKSAENIEAPQIPGAVIALGQKFIEQLWAESSLMGFKKIAEIERTYAKTTQELTSALKAKDTELKQTLSDFSILEEKHEQTEQESQNLQLKAHQKDGEIALLKEQLAKKEVELSSLLERAVRAEKDIELLKSKK